MTINSIRPKGLKQVSMNNLSGKIKTVTGYQRRLELIYLTGNKSIVKCACNSYFKRSPTFDSCKSCRKEK